MKRDNLYEYFDEQAFDNFVSSCWKMDGDMYLSGHYYQVDDDK